MVILNEAKPKYEKLNELFENYLLDIRLRNQVNVIIDLKEILKKFFRPDVNIENVSQHLLIEEVASDIINVLGHYRNYFYKSAKYTTFYVLYSFDMCEELIKEFPEYKKEYYEKYFNKTNPQTTIAKKAAQIVERVVERTPNAYFIETSRYDEFIYAKHIVESIVKDNELTVILSNDTIFYQLLKNNIVLLNLKGIKSELVTADNALSVLSKKDDIDFSINLLPLVLSIAGSKKHSITNVPGFAINKAITFVSKLVADGKVIDGPSIEIPINFSNLNPKTKLEKLIIESKDIITKNYNFIRGDIIYNKNKISLVSNLILTNTHGNLEFFKHINSKVFSMFPIQLDMLLKGEKI